MWGKRWGNWKISKSYKGSAYTKSFISNTQTRFLKTFPTLKCARASREEKVNLHIFESGEFQRCFVWDCGTNLNTLSEDSEEKICVLKILESFTADARLSFVGKQRMQTHFAPSRMFTSHNCLVNIISPNNFRGVKWEREKKQTSRRISIENSAVRKTWKWRKLKKLKIKNVFFLLFAWNFEFWSLLIRSSGEVWCFRKQQNVMIFLIRGSEKKISFIQLEWGKLFKSNLEGKNFFLRNWNWNKANSKCGKLSCSMELSLNFKIWTVWWVSWKFWLNFKSFC